MYLFLLILTFEMLRVAMLHVAPFECLSLYSVDSLRALICYCFVNYCLLY